MNGGMPDDALAATLGLEVLGLAQATRAVLGDPLTPKTGIGFVIGVERVFGMPDLGALRAVACRCTDRLSPSHNV
jgi:hypothetical protein